MALWLLICLGLSAGFVNGLLGTGGGIVLIFVIKRYLKKMDSKDVFVLTLTVTVAMSAVSAVMYYLRGDLDVKMGLKYGICAVPGGIMGAYLLDKLKYDTVRKAFGLLVIWAGLNMIGVMKWG